ncbi:MAG: VOC family protein [Candidatus Latescibacteria bacterium]|nr:VOC family protein [bacterium]MBD3422988.1 VOC family protein [Candidatus Latescibacterota bacterium]
MKLGAFSVSLNVSDIHESRVFYENLGFEVFGGELSENWLIMKNGSCTIGLFEGMFEGNLLTFNPGWDSNASRLDSFTDIRDIQRELKGKGIKIGDEVDEASEGPASFIITDPDGNRILLDQHI